MKVASVNWRPDEITRISNVDDLIGKMDSQLYASQIEGVQLVLFPAFTGILYLCLQQGGSSLEGLVHMVNVEKYLDNIAQLSKRYDMIICPGSYWKQENEQVYHASCIFTRGEMVLEQKQIYLARWERSLGITRGTEVKMFEFGEWKIGIILGTDVFYPQVSRHLGVNGTNLVLSPVGFVGEQNQWVQFSGMWREVQQNQFFAVESGFSGKLVDTYFWGESTVLAPVEMTPEENGYLVRSGVGDAVVESMTKSGLITAGLDDRSRRKAIRKFDVLKQLNPAVYREMGMFGVKE